MKHGFRYVWNKILSELDVVDYKIVKIKNRPANFSVPPNTVILIGEKKFYKWAILECPCGCKETLTLSLMVTHSPNWRVKFDKWQRVSFSPSIWKNEGCRSHFFIKKGKVIWSLND